RNTPLLCSASPSASARSYACIGCRGPMLPHGPRSATPFEPYFPVSVMEAPAPLPAPSITLLDAYPLHCEGVRRGRQQTAGMQLACLILHRHSRISPVLPAGHHRESMRHEWEVVQAGDALHVGRPLCVTPPLSYSPRAPTPYPWPSASGG